jgi:dienelactone hydrolase
MQLRIACFCLVVLFLLRPLSAADTLPGTAALIWPEEDLSGRMMDGAHQFVERKIAEAKDKRQEYWPQRANSSDPAIEANRQRLREIVGAVDQRVPPRLERFGDDVAPALVADAPNYRVYQVRWSVLDGLNAEGLFVEQKGGTSWYGVYLSDSNQTPEQCLGLAPGLPPEQQAARRLAENGCQLLIPVLIERKTFETDDPQIRRSNQTSREWLYRQSYHMGRHLIGYEVQKTLAAVDWLEAEGDTHQSIGVYGYGEGGLIALYAAALDYRIATTVTSGYFGSREKTWSEPLDRNVWSILSRFGDAEIASLVTPNSLTIEHAEIPTFSSPKGELDTPSGESVRTEFNRIQFLDGGIKPELLFGPTRPRLVIGKNGEPQGPLSVEALGLQKGKPLATEPPKDLRHKFDPRERQRRAITDIERHIQNLLRRSEQLREKNFLLSVMPEFGDAKWNTEKSLPTKSADKFIDGAKAFREKFAAEAIGRFDEPVLPPNPRTRKILETDKWTAYDVVLDVWPEVFAWGALVVPKDIKPGEKRPVVVCQHGRNGLPRMLIDGNETAYNQFAARLAERGFVTFAPHNLYRGEDRYRWLNRKANTIGATLFSFIVAQHDQILRWLEQQPFVDGNRMAFYGLSYGGETAVRVPPILEKYCLSICSGDFNQWTTKVASTDQPFSFMRTIEWEMPYWNWGQTFDYAEMAYLMIPRPFMVERGHLDLVGRDQWVAHEYAKVRWLYAQLGLSDKTEIEFFQGGHSIHGQATFDFLRKNLSWPAPLPK